MNHLLRVTLTSSLFLCLWRSPHAISQETEYNIQTISSKIEKVFNNNDWNLFKGLIAKKDLSNIKNQYSLFSNRFPNAKWTVRPAGITKDKKPIVEVLTYANIKKNDRNYVLKASQKLELTISNNMIVNHELFSSYSKLESLSKPIGITIGIPDQVLTGSRYDIDIIINEPLGENVLSGGLISLSNDQIRKDSTPYIEISPIASGGIFKSVQAPFKPGTQTWAALLAHTDGIVSITKTVRIVTSLVNQSP